MRIINFSDARNSLRAVIDQVLEDADVTIISRRDAADAVVMSLDHYTSLSGCWSRRIDESNRLEYQVHEDALLIISCRYHHA
ncbi:type II toxin-antitoxin system prevent-host-death family antitoxin [Pseudoduganella aquatica]|uniref:type II toxin-antitoxin system prevent-host-death family antitoxin n=1 Tax=Pseudoduganella aquatica TaxID=2660641 RepID=UPI001E291A1B|nr:type II toxin-antitoxin system prevent-host-death family antitoxin [Pseudoduganella aquatica]